MALKNKENNYASLNKNLINSNATANKNSYANDRLNNSTSNQNIAKNLYEQETPDSSQVTSENPYDDALAKAKRDQNYKSFYNTAIQLYNMKNNANKYLSNQLANQGLNTQGYGTSSQVGINNQAANLYAENLANYNNTEQDITNDAIDRYNSAQTEQDNQLVTFIQNAINNGGGTYEINKFLKNYGYMDSKGNYTDKWNNLDGDRKAYIQSVIDGADTSNETISSNLEYNGMKLSKWLTYNEVPGYEANDIGKLYSGNMSGENLNNISTLINNAVNNGEVKDGTLMYIPVNTYSADSGYILYYGGKYYKVDSTFYHKYKGNKLDLSNKLKILETQKEEENKKNEEIEDEKSREEAEKNRKDTYGV